jgi:glucose dehydrogenase
VEATPLVVDGVMYVTASWSVVHAIDVRTGKRLWTYDPKVPASTATRAAATWSTVASRCTRARSSSAPSTAAWSRWTRPPARRRGRRTPSRTASRPYTITGAPRVIKGKVIIGNGGAEYGVRGYITAYDAETGEQKWRWYTVPGDPASPSRTKRWPRPPRPGTRPASGGRPAAAAPHGDTMAFDPELNLMYVGTGNGSPWAHAKRSPKGGDNLYLASIVALNPDTGKYVWHYQETPGDNWDYTSHAADDPGRPDDRRQAAQGDPAGRARALLIFVR